MIDILAMWGLTPQRPRTDIILSGSPERCVTRMAVEDTTGRVWMLEKLLPGQFDRRERIGRTLLALEQAGLPVPAYLPDANGHFVVEQVESHYQLSPFVPGDTLPQPDYIEDTERGTSLGKFVCALRTASAGIHAFDTVPDFILEEYINEFMGTIALRRPEINVALLPVLPVLTPLFTAWPTLPRTLSQGDMHPLNVIWQGHSVAAVIDWEFAGLRPALFDVANCLGCVGIEDPTALVRGFSLGLLRSLKDSGCLELTNFSLLPELILGLRFAWISEWLRRGDTEMAEIELRYMRLLANSIDTLLPAWTKALGV